jgi:electron transfer flavoprotein beta subunit
MRVVALYKWAPNPQDAQVDPDGIVDWRRAAEALSEYDPVAFEIARSFADLTGAEVIGVTAGGSAASSSLARKTVLSRGIDRLVLVADDRLTTADSTTLAAVLASLIRRIGQVDLVLAGVSSVDINEGQVSMTLAAHLGWIGLGGVRAVEATDQGMRVKRDVAGGSETLTLGGGAVLTTVADAAVPRRAGMRDILAAAKKPVELVELDDLDVPVAQVVVSRVATSRPDNAKRQHVVVEASEPAAAAAQVISALRQRNVL